MNEDPFGIYKAKKKEPSGAAIAGAGATTAGVGYVAGGMPKKKVSLDGVNFTQKPANARQLVRDKAKVAGKMAGGGILGFRTKVHEGGLYGFNQAKTKDEWSGAPKNSQEAFKHGRNAGKIAPEVKVIRHMSGGRKAAHLVAAGGVAAVGYGAGKEKRKAPVAKRDQRKNDALVGAGTAGAGISAGGGALLRGQKKSWAKTAGNHIDQGGQLAPKTAGRKTSRTGKLTMNPKVSDGDIIRGKLMNGLDLDTARKVGEHRGAAAQARHFSHVYGNTGKVVAIGGGAASAAALHNGLKNRKKPIVKARSMSDAEIRRRKKVQGHISQTTGALGLAALGGTLLATKRGSAATKAAFTAAGKERPAVLKPKNLRKKTAPLLATSAGIGGAGAFNFASYTGAEAKKRGPRTPVKEPNIRKNMDTLDLGTFGEEGIAKNWQPSTNQYDPEKNRAKRASAYETGSSATAIGAGGAAVGYTVKGQKESGRADRATEAGMKLKGQKKNPGGFLTQAAHHEKKAKAFGRKATKATGIAVAASAAGLGVDQWRKKEFGKSAFGVEHD